MDYGIRWPSSDNNGGLNFHGMFMSTGLVFFQGEALISYRLYRYDTKLLSKFVHVVFHMLAMAFFSTALAAMILQKNAHGWSHFTSVHSWIGIAVMFVFVVQFLFGFVNFLVPGISDDVRRRFCRYTVLLDQCPSQPALYRQQSASYSTIQSLIPVPKITTLL